MSDVTVDLGMLSEQPEQPRFERRPADAFRLQPGDHVAGYRIEQLIGVGGAGAVYRAVDENLGRQVALKVMPRDSPGDDAQLRFIREAKAATAVDHPNIIPVYDAGESDDGILYIAMRYVRGGDVRALLASEGPLPPERAMAIIAPVAAALDEAHEAGLVHRDVKPGNMLLDSRPTAQDHVYLTDFGITTVSSDTFVQTAHPTRQIIGTPSYMAPEQLEAGPIDGRADEYALACSAFEMLSGTPPFQRDSLPSLVLAIIQEPPPAVTSRRPELPVAVDAVFARALAKSPAERYATCAQFAEALGMTLGLAHTIASEWTAPETRAWSPPPTDGEESPDGPVPGLLRALDVGLKPTFRYVHEPSRASDAAFASLGNDDLMDELDKRIRYSRGGAFLITGFRGVGKSTMVMRALDQLAARGAPTEVIIPVMLSVARSMKTERLLFAIVRRVFETLSDLAVLDMLPPQTRHALLVSYMRTSLSYTETQTKGSQQGAELDIGLGSGKLVKAVADIAAPQVKLSAGRSHSLETAATFLAYSETDVEYDLMRIIALVSGAVDAPLSRAPRWRWPRRRRQSARPRMRLVIVLDEVDKLTADDQGLAAVEGLLSGTKNVLATSGAHFLVIAGPDLHDRAVRDAARGSGVYESVFGWRLYVPCSWDAPKKLLADIVSADWEEPAMLETLEHYLRFKARGVPRRLLQEVNHFVVWSNDDQPRLRISPWDMERVAFYARMERIMRAYMEGDNRDRLFPVPIDEDRWRLGSYFVVDWVLQSKGEPFTAADLLREGEDPRFDPLLRISRRSIDRLLDHLARHDVLVADGEDSGMKTVLSDVAESQERGYHLSDEILALLSGFATHRETERAARDVSLDLPSPALSFDVTQAPVPGSRAKVLAGRYEYDEIIEQGALSVAYKGRDLVTGRPVAVKLLRPAMTSDPVALARFRREAEITRKLNHAQVVRAYDVVDGPTDYAIVLERLIGSTLEEMVVQGGPMSPGEVAGMGQALGMGISYLSAMGIIRLDLKPSSITMADRGPVIGDLGIAFDQEASNKKIITVVGGFVGTPAYMAPEALEDRPVDSRADIYALSLVMFYCLGGRTPWHDLDSVPAIAYRVLNQPIDVSGLHISESFRQVLRKAMARAPQDRYRDGADLAEALRQTPEWQDLHAGPAALELDASTTIIDLPR